MLEIRELVKIYPRAVTALDGVDLDVPRGLFGLLGPNGSGKTTLMRILAGLVEPTGGRVRFAGEDVTGRPERVWPRLGYLPQDFGFYPNLTGRAMLLHVLALKGVEAPGGRRALAAELLERVHLGEAAGRPVGGYSGGMRRRLGIAQAIAGDPELLIVDEPTAGLDPEERYRFNRLLAEIAADRVVVLSTHTIEDVEMLCPRLAILVRGRVVAATTPAEARAALAGTIYEGEAEGELGGPGVEPVRGHLVGGRHVVRLRIAGGGTPPPGFRPVAPTLEDAYLLAARQAGAADGAPA